jgi:hypothetical protein
MNAEIENLLVLLRARALRALREGNWIQQEADIRHAERAYLTKRLHTGQ